MTVASATPSGLPEAWRFPVESGEFDADTDTTTLDLGGYVHFRGYFDYPVAGKWGLDTRFSDLRLVISPEEQVLRGTHTGYLREDPGGELYEDVDVVLARLDIATGTSTFGPPTTSLAGVQTVAGPGLSVYGEGTVLDDIAIDYEGPGGLPDLTEHFDAPGVPALEPAAAYSLGYKGTGDELRRLLVSGDGATLFAFTRLDGAAEVTVRALDAATMTPVGHPFTYRASPAGDRLYRFAIDPATDTLFFLTANGGEPVEGDASGRGVENVVHSLTFDGTDFTEGTVGRLRDSQVTSQSDGTKSVHQVFVSALTWNPVAEELLVAQAIPSAQRPDIHTSDDLYRFTRDGSGWTRAATPFRMPDSGGEWGDATEPIESPVSTINDYAENLAVLGDGSYVIATGESPEIRYDDSGSAHYMGALHLRFGADGAATVAEIADTVLRPYFGGFYYSGYTAVRSLPDGRAVLHGNGGSLDDIAWVGLDGAGAAVTGATVVGTDVYPPYELSSIGGSVAYAPVLGGLWVADEGDSDGEYLHYYDGTTDVTGFKIRKFADYQFGHNQIHALPDGSVVVPMTDFDAPGQPNGWLRLELLGVTPKVTTQPDSVAVELGRDQATRPVTFTAAVDAGIADEYGSDLQWQVRAAGAATFTDVAGATSATLEVTASPETAGSAYRLRVSNAAGTVVSDEASLAVTYPPRFTLDARNVSVTEGSDAQLLVDSIASPEHTVTWQRRVGGYWTDIAEDDENFVVATEGGRSVLTVVDTNVDQSGSVFRAKLRNDLGITTAPPCG
ncbi:HtaA domain-containing protein [Nocardioides humi]|uniref:HtaA domain-containing protein n=1 Tax=Nocardioides humi TaxID=449461 RepID=UPI0015E84D72|nr:HtaA domain-containing protein [Nocardioides humi]